MRLKGYRTPRLVACSVLSLMVLGGAGCPLPGEPTGDEGTDGSPTEQARPTLKNGVAGFNLGAVLTESYWYSRYDLGSLVMKSGLGETFMPDMTMVGAMVDLVSDATSSAAPPKNAALLKRVFSAGNPEWINPGDGDPMDFGDERWAFASDTSTSAAAAGWTIIKEVEWGRQFHVDGHFGAPGGDDNIPGAQERFAGLVLCVEAIMQGAEWINNPDAFDTSDLGGMYVMLAALNDLGDVTAAPTLPNSASNRTRAVADMIAVSMEMADADALSEWFLAEADRLFDTLETPTGVEDLALAIQSLMWYASVRSTNREAAKVRIGAYADTLLAEPKSGSIDHARAIRGLLEAHRLRGEPVYLTAASESFDALVNDFDWANGVFTRQSTYSTDDVAWVLGALNALKVHGEPGRIVETIDLTEHFFEAVVNLSGLQVSAPPVESIAAYERHTELSHRYPTTPLPRNAGGEHGIAPVFADSVTWDADRETWIADRTRYDTAGAMHLSSEMLWSFGEVSAFPEVP